jgi:hypothetical protein
MRIVVVVAETVVCVPVVEMVALVLVVPVVIVVDKRLVLYCTTPSSRISGAPPVAVVTSQSARIRFNASTSVWVAVMCPSG